MAASKEEDKRFLSQYTSEAQFAREYKRSYHGKPKSRELYLLVLSELENAIVKGKIDIFKRFAKVLGFINNIESHTTLKTYYNDRENPIKTTNLVILACKYNEVEILKYVLGNTKILENLSFNVGKEVETPDCKDDCYHNAFYYAVRSGNTDLLDTLIKKWPGNYFTSRAEELDDVLSRAYEELKFKNVSLSESIEIFVERKLIGLRFFSNRSGQVQISADDRIINIKERIDLVLEKIDFLKSEYSKVEKVDEKFLFVARFIAQNIHVLKRQLRLTYDRLPWEEIEFCLVSFVSSHLKYRDVNLFYRTILNKCKVLSYLENFAKKLENEKHLIEIVNINRLAELPKLKRDQVVEKIIRHDPEFEALYIDYQRIRDIHSLEKISEYLNLALSCDPKEREGQLIITRSLQVIGEYLKNTLESPNLSNTTSDLLLMSLPNNTRKVVIDLRNSLSHAQSLSKRTEIEEKTDTKFFIGVQNDSKRIDNVVTDILYNNKMKMIRILLQNILNSESLVEIKTVAEILKHVKLDKMTSGSFKMMEVENLEKLIRELDDAVPDKTDYEMQLFNKINNVITSAKTKSENTKTNYSVIFALLRSVCVYLEDICLNEIGFEIIKRGTKTALENMCPQNVETDNLEEIAELVMKFSSSVRSRMQGDDLDNVLQPIIQIFYIAEFGSNDIKWIEKLREKLYEKGSLIPVYKVNQTCDMTEDDYNKQLLQKLTELKTILKNGGIDSKFIEKLSLVKKNRKLQAVVEMLVLDIMSILGRSEKHFENNFLFIDDNTPLLTGKCLRNHLAHGNTILDVLLSDPSVAIVLNAEKLVSENIVKSDKKLGKLVEDDPSKLKYKFDQFLVTVENQDKMFAALREGNLEELKICLSGGADINAKNIDSLSALHFASCGPSLEIVKFVLDQNLDINIADESGQSPLHVAAAHGRNNIVEFFLTKARVSVDVLDNSGKTPLHLAAKNGHKDTVKILLANNANINANDVVSFAPLHYAIQCNHVDVVKVLLEKETDVDINEFTGGSTPLHMAAEFGCLEIIKLLLSRGANVNAKNDKDGIPLHAAAIYGHLEITEILIREGSDVNARCLDGCTPLRYAVEYGHPEGVCMLLKNGANVNIADKTLNSAPLIYAIHYRHEKIVDILLNHKANAEIATTNGMVPLHFAVQSGNLKIVSSLIKHGVNIHIKDKSHSTALHYAAECGQKEIAQLLIQNGADIKAENCNNSTPLHAASLKGHVDIADLLIRNKAEIEARDIMGNTPLYAAAQNGDVSVVNLLIKNSADVDAKTHDGLTPLHAAALGGHVDVIVILIQNKAEVNAMNYLHGLTPLYPAILQGHKDVVKILIENKAEVNVKSRFGCTPLYAAYEAVTPLLLAVQAGHKEIVDILVSNKADVNVVCNDLIPLVCAIKNNHKEIVEVLIANGADVNVEGGKPLSRAVLSSDKDIVNILLQNNACIDIKGSVLLILAAKRGHIEIIKALITGGSDVNAMSQEEEVTPLHVAAQDGHEEIAEILIANGANVNNSGVNGTPLHSAAISGHKDLVNVLICNGAKIDVKDGKNRTPLQLAVARGHLHVVKLLLQHTNLNINARGNDDWTVLHIAAQENNLEIVKYLVSKGADINAKNTSGSKPVHIAAREGFKDIIDYFLSKGFNINEFGSHNQTLLCYAVMKNHLDLVKYLISKGADVNAKDDNGSTPMHIAALLGFKDIIVVLLENGAVYNSENNLHLRPLEMSSEKNVMAMDTSSEKLLVKNENKDVTNILASTEKLFEAVKRNSSSEVEKCIKLGAFINAKNADTETTPLHYAAWKGRGEVVDILLQYKANPNAVCSKRFTPLHYASKFSHFECVKTLLFHGAIYNAVSDTGKTPSDFTTNKDIATLLKVIDDSFKKVKNCNYQVVADLNKIKDCDTLRAIMNACNMENKTLIAVAPQSDSLLAKQLKQVSQGDVSAELEEANVLIVHGSYQRGMSIYKRLYEKRKQLLGPDNPATLEIQTYLARGLYKQGNYLEALDMLEEISQKQKAMLGLDNKDTLETRSMIGLVYHRLGKDHEAFSILKDVHRRQKEILGPTHPDTLNTHFHIAIVFERLGRFDEALSINRSVYEIYKNTLGSRNVATVSALNNIAMILDRKGEHEEALKIYNQVLEKKKSILGIYHADTMRTLHNIGAVYQHQKKYQEALKTLQEVLDIQKKALQPNHPEILNTQHSVANILFEQNKYIAALKIFKECYDQRVAIFGPFHESVIDIARKIEVINLRFKFEGSNSSEVFQHLQTDINVASNKGDVKAVRVLLQNGADVNDRDIDGRTPLHFAVSNGHVNIVNILLKNGADVTHATNKGNTPLHTATSKNNHEIVEKLLQHVSRDKLNDFVNAKTASGGTTSLHVAAKNGCLDVVKSLLKNGATYDIVNKEGKKPIDLSADQKTISLFELTDEVFKGVKKGNAEAINKLKAMKPDVFSAITNARNAEGHGLMQVALVNKRKNIASMLLEILKKTDSK